MKVSVVTPNYNGKHLLKTYFDSLITNKEAIGEVIIVDNGSNDGRFDFYEYDLNSNDDMDKIEALVLSIKDDFDELVYINCAAVVWIVKKQMIRD